VLTHSQRTPLSEGDPIPPEDRVIIARGDELDAIYRQEQPDLVRFVKRHTSIEQALDLVQQTFVRFAGLDRVKRASIASPKSYLRRVALNLSTDAARAEAQQRSSTHVSLDDIDIADADPLSTLEARDILSRLDAVLQRLKPRTREIFLAQRIDGMTYAEIAGRTGLSVKAVEKHMSRAILHIDRFLHKR
jgi:RNA polymerase sigma factor (sigma-70 family)